jgi:hypothetical protein
MTSNNPIPLDKLNTLNDLNYEFYNNLVKRTDNLDDFLTLDEVEMKYRNLHNQRGFIDDECLSYFLSNIDENEIIKRTKEEYRNYGIRLRTNLRTPITIQTDLRKITINRYLLTPYTKEERQLLFKMDGKNGVYPLDKYLGISNLPFKMTVEAMLKVTKKAIESNSYQKASDDLRNDCGIVINPHTIADVTDHIGYLVFKRNYEKSHQKYSEFISGNNSIFSEDKLKFVLYLQVDGSFICTRDKDSNDSGWREVKLGMVYSSKHMHSVKRTDKHGKIVTEYVINVKDYIAYIGCAKEFQKFFFECACKNGYGRYEEVVLISDGASWISNLKEDLFPDAIHILDFFHLSEKIWDLGKSFFNIIDEKDEENKKYSDYKSWCNHIIDSLEESKYQDVKKDIEQKLKKVNNRNKLKKNNLIDYIEKHISNIDYKTYINKGYSIGSGAIEGANKNVLQQRLKLLGMRWNRDSAQAIAILRSKLKGVRWFEDVVCPVREHYNLPIFNLC